MKVFKFGGASINSIDRINKVRVILGGFPQSKLLIVVSAMGKITNALEEVVSKFFDGDQASALRLFGTIKQQHLDVAAGLFGSIAEAESLLADFLTEIEWLLHDKPVRGFDYYYDQVVSIGELLSSAILARHLFISGLKVEWMDVRDIIRTDNNFRDATIDWSTTQQKVTQRVLPCFQNADIVLTQGFIGATDENESTTLGREGSDYSAAVFASMLDAGSLTIWKDVEGIMNADPKRFPNAVVIPELNYEEVIEMAYYGAQVIHPKTIQPLQNKSIPLEVKCFLDPNLPGSIIHNANVKKLPPIMVLKEEQAIVHLHSRNFSFISAKPMEELYALFALIKITPNLVQTAAVHISICIDDNQEKIERLAFEASSQFEVTVAKGLQLLTVRHYQPEMIEQLLNGKSIELRQQTPTTIQVVIK